MQYFNDKQVVNKKNNSIEILIIFKICVKSYKDWYLLSDYIDSAKPLKSYLESDRRVNHYIERIFYYTNRAPDREPCSFVLKQINDIFSNVKLIYQMKTYFFKISFILFVK